MYYRKRFTRSKWLVEETYPAETLETKVAQIMAGGTEPDQQSPIIYTERKDGVRPEFDIRTDRFDLAISAMDVWSGSAIAQRQALIEAKAKEEEESTESSQ